MTAKQRKHVYVCRCCSLALPHFFTPPCLALINLLIHLITLNLLLQRRHNLRTLDCIRSLEIISFLLSRLGLKHGDLEGCGDLAANFTTDDGADVDACGLWGLEEGFLVRGHDVHVFAVDGEDSFVAAGTLEGTKN